MTQVKFNHAKISGISVVVPENEINIYDEVQYYQNDIKKVDRMRKMVGFHKRRVGELGVTASDMSIQAAEKLLNDMSIDRNSIDALIYVVQRPDYKQPATCFYIHHKLKLSNGCTVIDIHHGCPGWVYGLYTASQMIDSGSAKRVLLMAGDTPATGMNPQNRIAAPVFGDGGTATLLEYSDRKVESFYDIETVSDNYEAIITPAGGHRLPFRFNGSETDHKLSMRRTSKAGYPLKLVDGHMDGMAVFDFTINCVPPAIKRLMAYADVSTDDLDHLLLHQANKQIVEGIARAAGFPAGKASYEAFENYGNNTMCSIPTSINHSLTPFFSEKKGNLKVLCSAFGNGLAIASCIMDLSENLYLSGVQDYKKTEDFKTIDQQIDYWIEKLTQ